MYRSSMSEADQRIRAAEAACAEHERLTERRTRLLMDLGDAERRCAELAGRLGEEEADVSRYEHGVWAFLYDVFADREGRLQKERSEALAAHSRAQEATALRDRLQQEMTALDARLQELAGAERERAAALKDKEAAILDSDDPAAATLSELAAEEGRLDASIVACDEAITAGHRARDALARLEAVLSSARAWGTADFFSDSLLVSWGKRNKLDEAKGLAGRAQAELALFQRELADVGIELEAKMADLADHHRFLDVWFDNIFSDLSVQSRITEAQRQTVRVRGQVERRVAEVERSREAMSARRQELGRSRERLLRPS